MTKGGPQIRLMTTADDVEAELDLRRRSFGPISAALRPSWVKSVRYSIDGGHMIGVFDGARLAGSARYHPMRQWWHGRSMPMAGVAGVKIAPEERGRGTGRAMMARLLEVIAAAGYPVSALYPTTAPVYRASGWEFAGYKYETVLQARSLAVLVPPASAAAPEAKLRRATPDDGELIVQIKGQVHGDLRHCGPNTREPWILHDWLDDEDHFTYLADDGFLSYRWAHGTDEIEVEEVTAGSAATARAFWQLLAGHATVATTVRACLGPADPVSWLTRDPAAVTSTRDAWMLRIIDAPAAIAGRGYPAAASLSAELDLTDAALPANAGRWTLEISGGEGRLLAAGGHGPGLRLDEHGFAALYAGTPLSTLRLAGLAAGGSPAADDALDCAFAGPAFMDDYF